MLHELGLTNFKPFGVEQCAPLAPLTLIYGPNSGGKSSIIQSLMLLKQTIEGSADTMGLISRGSLVDLGSYKALIHRHEVSRDLSLRYAFDFGNRGLRFGSHVLGIPPDARISVELSYGSAKTEGSRKKDSSKLTDVRYGIDSGPSRPNLDIRLKRTDAVDKINEYFINGMNAFSWGDAAAKSNFVDYILDTERQYRSRQAEVRGPSTNEPTDLPTRKELLNAFDKCLVIMEGGIPVRLTRTDFSDHDLTLPFRSPRHRLIEGVARQFSRLFESMSYLGPLRSSPERHYIAHGGTPSSVGKRGEFTPQMLFMRKRELQERVNDWFSRFDIPYHLEVRPLEDEVTGAIIVMLLKDKRTKVSVAPSDVGFGIGQLLPILVEGLFAKDRIICVEQPEIHLHPRLQAHLADFFIATSGGTAQDKRRSRFSNQWIIETHSESLILRVQKHIRSGALSSKHVSVLYVDPSQEGSQIRQLRLDSDGEFLDPWPLRGAFRRNVRSATVSSLVYAFTLSEGAVRMLGQGSTRDARERLSLLTVLWARNGLLVTDPSQKHIEKLGRVCDSATFPQPTRKLVKDFPDYQPSSASTSKVEVSATNHSTVGWGDWTGYVGLLDRALGAFRGDQGDGYDPQCHSVPAGAFSCRVPGALRQG
jgi:predicted ATPase